MNNPVLGGAATCSKGFVICFLKVPLACLGSMSVTVQPNSLGTLRKHFTKLSEQVAAPPGTGRSISSPTWVGLTFIWQFQLLPGSAWADGKLAELAVWLGKMVEHTKSKFIDPCSPGDGPPLPVLFITLH